MWFSKTCKELDLETLDLSALKVAITLEECVECGLVKHVSSWTWNHLILESDY